MLTASTTPELTPYLCFAARGLLLHDNPTVAEWAQGFLNSKGIRPEAADWRHQILESMRTLSFRIEGHKGRLVDADFILEGLMNHYLPEKTREAIELRRVTTRIVIAEEVFDILEELRERGYRLAVLSNEGAELVEVLRLNRLLDYFQFVLTADDVALPKPNLDLFHQAMEEFSTHQEKIIHIGDRYIFDSAPAHRLGWQTILYDPTGIERDAYAAQAPEAESKVVSLETRRASKNFRGARVIEKLSELLEICK
jgi:HAD superfamily hydrolase (TIGR01549 family)